MSKKNKKIAVNSIMILSMVTAMLCLIGIFVIGPTAILYIIFFSSILILFLGDMAISELKDPWDDFWDD